MTGAEYLGAAVCAVVLLIFIPMGGRLQGAVLYTCYAFSLFTVLTSLLLSLFKIYYLSKTDLGGPVTETSRRIAQFKLMIAKERLWSIIFFPAIILCVFAVVNYWIAGTNIFDEITIYLPRILIGLAVGIPAALLIYQKVYMSGIRQIKANLKELEEFIRPH